jgi:hypothetical protein
MSYSTDGSFAGREAVKSPVFKRSIIIAGRKTSVSRSECHNGECGCGKKFHRRPLRRSAIGGGRYFLNELTGTATPSLFAPQRTTTTSASIGSRKMRTTIPRSPVARSWTRVPTGYLGLLSIAAPASGRRVSLLHGGSRLPEIARTCWCVRAMR